MADPWRAEAAGIRLDVRLTPRGGRDAVEGVDHLADGRAMLRCRVRAAPTDGEANAALVALLAKALDLPKRRIALVAGATARLKSLSLEGDPVALIEALRRLVAATPDSSA